MTDTPKSAVGGRRLRLAIRGLAILLLTATLPWGAAAELEVGQPAPEFAFQGSDGKSYTLSGLLSSGTGGVVLAFFPKAFTPG